MVINTNVSALSSARMLSESSSMLSKSLARLSSGSKITSAADDAAGLAVSTRFDAQINRISATRTGISNAISFSQTQDGYLQKVTKALDRMSELSVLAQDVTKSTEDIALYQTEFSALATYISDLASKEFNTIALFGGDDLDVVVDSEGGNFTMTGIDGSAYDLSGSDLSSDAATAQSDVTKMIDTVATDRATVGANMSVLTSYNDQLAVLKENLSAASSRIKDVDVAEESTNFARYNILVQAGTAMLAQANASSQSALRLLS
jgi:flagellin